MSRESLVGLLLRGNADGITSCFTRGGVDEMKNAGHVVERFGGGAVSPSSPAGAVLEGITRALGRAGRSAFRFVGDAGRLAVFLSKAIARLPRRPFRGRAIVAQIDFVGARSVTVIALSATFTGLVLALQGYSVLVRFGSANLVGSLVALSLTRELAPVLTGLMVSARAGSAMAATIGNMAVTEQIDALDSLAVDPISYLVVPRLLAAIVCLPLLAALFSLAGIAAAYLLAVGVLSVDGLAFMSNVRSSVEWKDVWVGLVKAAVFGAILATLATFRGYETRGGADGVGRSTSRTVVESAVLILCGDYVMTALLF
jgi:phospholipid/cholesterol/gamma-HCH transport system permease protein